jgi:phenylacetate-CoA ligase
MQHLPTIETASWSEQQKVQELRLNELLTYIAERSPYYATLLKQQGYRSTTRFTLDDLATLPTTSKEDVQENQQQFFCVPPRDIVEYAATSGTMGSPVNVALTKNDLQRLAYNEFLSFGLMQVSSDDIVQLMLTLDRQFMAGVAYYAGVKEIGAAAVRTGPGLPASQIETLQRLQVNVAVAVPSFLTKLIEYADKHAIQLSSLPLKKVLCIGEAIREPNLALGTLGKYIVDRWPLQLFSTYASTEMQTAFTECEHGAGGHHHPELIIFEIVDEEGKVLGAGEFGEVVITTLGVEAMPLLRYRTGDICCYYEEPCACGRTTRRLSPVKGRKKQMIKYKGTTLYPPALFDMLNHFREINEYVVEVYTGALGTDEMILHIATQLPVDDCERLLKPFLQSRLRVIPTINYLSSSEMHDMQFANASRKPIRFLDKRLQYE